MSSAWRVCAGVSARREAEARLPPLQPLALSAHSCMPRRCCAAAVLACLLHSWAACPLLGAGLPSVYPACAC